MQKIWNNICIRAFRFET